MITIETCSFCGGSKKAERLEERTEAGNWVPNNQLAQSLWDGCVEAMPNRLRLITDDCPRCGGAGEYIVEHVTCKVF